MEAAKKILVTTHELRDTGFEPEILAYCCEH